MVTALPFILSALCVLALAYRYYSAFIAARILSLSDSRKTPAHTLEDGHNYVPTNRWVLFGHHFAAITGAGPLIGPVLAAQFGFLPGFLWLVIGVVLGGAVHDFILLTGSVRHKGKSIAQIADEVMGPWAGRVTALAILFIVVIALAGLGLAVVNALHESPWGTFTLAVTVPVALVMGVYMHVGRAGGGVREATVFGVIALLAALVLGRDVAGTWLGQWFTLSRGTLIVAIAAYGFIASVLPVWLLLCPRDYLSSFMKLGTIALLTVAVIFVNPEIKLPMFTTFTHGGGPIVPGHVYPFVFITIACGAISGFHSLIATGTTPKMISRESDCRPIGYGAMLCEGWVGITSLIAAAALFPGDYFAINVPAEKFATLGMHTVNLADLSQAVGESVAGRTGGAVSLAVGMAQIFSSLPGLRTLMAYWYHYAILFEALFILTTIDTGTRVARFLVQELFGRVRPEWGKPDWLPGTLLSTGLIVAGWSTLIWTGNISTIWPLFGIANQLLASIALVVATTLILKWGKGRYLWVTLLPLTFVAVTTVTAGLESVWQNFLPMAAHGQPVMGYLNAAVTLIMIAALGVILTIGLKIWTRGGNTPNEKSNCVKVFAATVLLALSSMSCGPGLRSLGLSNGPPSDPAPITLVQTATGNSGGTTASATLTPTVGNVLIAITWGAGSGLLTGSSVLDGSNGAYAVAKQAIGGVGSEGLGAIYWVKNTVATPVTATVTLTGTVTATAIALLEFSGLNTTGQPNVSSSDSSTSGSTGDTGTTGVTAQAKELLVAVLVIPSNGTFTMTEDVGWNSIFKLTLGASQAVGDGVYKVINSIGAQSALWSWSPAGSGGYVSAIATFKGVPWL